MAIAQVFSQCPVPTTTGNYLPIYNGYSARDPSWSPPYSSFEYTFYPSAFSDGSPIFVLSNGCKLVKQSGRLVWFDSNDLQLGFYNFDEDRNHFFVNVDISLPTNYLERIGSIGRNSSSVIVQRYTGNTVNFLGEYSTNFDALEMFSGFQLTPTPGLTLGEVFDILYSSPSVGFTISFNTNGGTPVDSLANQTELPDPLPTTTRDGFAFTGWYTDSSLIFPAVPGATITEDTTLYAGWRPNQFTVTFEANGGEPVSQLTNVNQLPDPLPTTLKVGNDFAGWFTEAELLHPAVPGAFISQNTTLYAKWIEQQSTDIHVPTVSAPSLLQTGFVTMWQPTLDEVRQLANFLWTTNLFDNLRKLFNDPMEAILFLGIVPFDVNTAERGNIYFGNLDTDVESTPIVQQYYTLEFGDINMTEYYHSFLDYEPATTVEIFLPFCGTHKLSANEVMGSVMNLKYNVDVFTGTCVAMLTITKPGIDSVMYSFEGNLMATIPVTAKNYSDLIRGVISAVASAGIKAVSVI